MNHNARSSIGKSISAATAGPLATQFIGSVFWPGASSAGHDCSPGMQRP